MDEVKSETIWGFISMNFLGIDYGEKNVGVAISSGINAEPFKTYFKNESIFEITQLVKKMSIDRCIVGLPQGELAESVKIFSNQLKKVVLCPVFFWDETLSSKIAQDFLIESPYSRKRRHEKEHETAAAIMLQSYLDHHKELL